MNQINTIIFDLGGVLIDWNPEYVFLNAFNGDREKMQWFFNNICTSDWNENQDAGYPLAQATKDLVEKFPEHEHHIKMFYGKWENMLGGPIDGTVKVLENLIKSEKYKLVALTNWSHETFPIAQKRFEFLKWFEGIVVSGDEKTRKPFKAIYDITLSRFNITPEKSLFIDDNLRNIEAANALGINGIHFETPEKLIQQLKEYNIQL
ncbi:Phosphorylated carbohydrates phosphatase [Mariniflexile rhizosphaerae]|uniref:HAD family hydrolase n=1 Tax=unclassified Mariniflexile TaxID=2643887 RepID=UPI000E32FB46|nr:HAD family phosphatase [Mariniflexile sp. TRM1-10]AXP82401.1 Phosphorylated carbohydrates phosphatase [Mariniflexile sp. TRM1-10]